MAGGKIFYMEDFKMRDFTKKKHGKHGYDSEKENDSSELPQIVSSYRGWSITAVLEVPDKYGYEIEIDRIEIYGDEIDEDSDIENFITDRIDEREEEKAEIYDYQKNYKHYMGLGADWEESHDPN